METTWCPLITVVVSLISILSTSYLFRKFYPYDEQKGRTMKFIDGNWKFIDEDGELKK